jgi:hypothetical protein
VHAEITRTDDLISWF